MNFNCVKKFFYNRCLWVINSFRFIQLIFIILRNDICAFDDKQLDRLKEKIISNGPISLKFMQWYITKKNIDNTDGQYDRILEKFDNIFEDCPFHSIEDSFEIFYNNFNSDISNYVKINTIKEIGSGSIGQVYKARLINDEEVAIKIKHPNIKNITSGQLYVINTLIFFQKWHRLYAYPDCSQRARKESQTES